MGYIYKITNTITGKIYVGKTSKTVAHRMKEHKRALHLYQTGKYRHKSHLYFSMDKYGFDNFSFEIICECPLEELEDAERYWINQLDTRNPNVGYNIHEGGNGGITWVEPLEVTDAQLSALDYGRHLPASDKLKNILQQYRLSVEVSDETRAKLREQQQGRIGIYNDIVEKNTYIKASQFEFYYLQGWHKGIKKAYCRNN